MTPEIGLESPSHPRIRACSYISTPEMWSQPGRHDLQFSMLPPQHNGYNAHAYWNTYTEGSTLPNWGFEGEQIPEGGEQFEQLDEHAPAYLASVYEVRENGAEPPPVSAYKRPTPISTDEQAECHVEETRTYYAPESNYQHEECNQVTPEYREMGEFSLTPARVAQDSPKSTLAPLAKSTENRNHSDTENHLATTLMFRNIPNKYTREMLLEEIGEKGFNGKYDFFYLPIDFRNRCNVGYAFINFISQKEAETFKYAFQGQQLKEFNSAKVCKITVAKVQGRDANVEQYRNSAVMNMDERYHPLIFDREKRLQFPEPTVGLRPFRPRSQYPSGVTEV